MFQLKQTVLQF